MNARPGRPPKNPDGKISTITLRLPADVKLYLMESSEATDSSMTAYICGLLRRDAGQTFDAAVTEE